MPSIDTPCLLQVFSGLVSLFAFVFPLDLGNKDELGYQVEPFRRLHVNVIPGTVYDCHIQATIIKAKCHGKTIFRLHYVRLGRPQQNTKIEGMMSGRQWEV